MARTPRQRTRHHLDPIKGSRFIATVVPVSDEDAARTFVAEIESEMPDATHHCWALRIARPAIERAVDAGEPGGSAGRPILAAMSGREVMDACVVVTRYYGGTKLGVGGLVRAYGGAAAAVLDQTILVEHVQTETWMVEHGYEDGPAVERVVATWGLSSGSVDYGEVVRREVVVPTGATQDVTRALLNATAGRARIERA